MWKFWRVKDWHILLLPGAFTFFKGQDLHSLTLRNESIGRDTSFLWIKLAHMHMAPLKWHRIMYNSPHFLVIQTTLPSPTNGSPLKLDDEGWRTGLWSEPILMWGEYLCCLYSKMKVKNHSFYQVLFLYVSLINFVFPVSMVIVKQVIRVILCYSNSTTSMW